MGRKEFVALIAMMMASVAFSIDAMLPALPQIGAELAPDQPQLAPLILTMFLLGMGIGTFFTGPLSDAMGRKRIIVLFSVLYIFGAALAWAAQSLELVLAARLIQGLGAAGPRVVALAVVRDRFAGRQMAQVVSVVMMIFTLVPAVAPLLGSFIIGWAGWRSIFAAFILFSVIFCTWVLFRLPETLPPEKRRPMKISLMMAAVGEMIAHPVARMSILVQTFVMSAVFLTLMLIQPIFDQVYGRGDEFPYWFFIVALIAGSFSMLNALLVIRFGMQRLVTFALTVQVTLSVSFLVFDLGSPDYGFYFFVAWVITVFCQASLGIGNLNALAMEPMGHIAGMAASVIGALSTVGAVVISGPVGAMFNGSERPLVMVVLALGAVSLFGMLTLKRTPRGRC